MTHPVQYYSPWFRFIAQSRPDIQLSVIYATVPTPQPQGVGFGVSFEWDTSPLDGYDSQVLRTSQPDDYLHSDRFFGLNASGMGRAIRLSLPDAVVSPGWYSVTLVKALTTCKFYGIPCIYRGDTPLRSDAGGVHGFLSKARTLTMLDFFQAYLSVGKLNREYLHHFGVPDSRIHFSPSCVDNDFFEKASRFSGDLDARIAVRKKLGIPAADFAILFIGKLDENKRPWDVLAATAELGENVTAVIVGSGPAEERCRAEAARLGVNAVFPGFVNQSGLGEYYGASDVCVLPSDRETWGLVVNESLASGTPCVVSDGVGCAPDLIWPGRTGHTFPARNVGALANALREIQRAKQEGHDFGEDCRHVVSGYSFEVATEGLVEAVRSIEDKR
jgi:glycosyltransferase involved in cell wall biosynthesis